MVRRFSNTVYATILHTLRARAVYYNTQDIEDLHHTVLLSLFDQGCRKLKQYQGKNGCSLASWIRVVTLRTVLNYLRKKGMDAPSWQKKKIPFEEMETLHGGNEDPLTLMEQKEQERLVENGIQLLTPRDRLFMKLHFRLGLPMEEVARAMEISVDNAYTIKHRSVERLRSSLISR
ncbi:MAG: sigma-70 family RNA polymerase sigma factor [Desulfobacterota bacterium]|nr:sigma-70 family RNA polymerase sigma factor [Thermodesulfobacteriota bacterium]